MIKDNYHPDPDFKGQLKSKGHFTQLQTIFQYLQKNVATASMVSYATGVPQKCITRYKRDLELSGRLWEVIKKRCDHTGFKAWYLTTDPDKAPKQISTQSNNSIQLSLF